MYPKHGEVGEVPEEAEVGMEEVRGSGFENTLSRFIQNEEDDEGEKDEEDYDCDAALSNGSECSSRAV